MGKLDDLYRLHRLLDGRRAGLSRAALTSEYGFSRSTLTRLIAGLRDRLGAPLIHDSERGGYRYDTIDGHHVASARRGFSKQTMCGNRKTRGKPRVFGFGSSPKG